MDVPSCVKRDGYLPSSVAEGFLGGWGGRIPEREDVCLGPSFNKANLRSTGQLDIEVLQTNGTGKSEARSSFYCTPSDAAPVNDLTM